MALEMAEGEPPYMDMPPLTVCEFVCRMFDFPGSSFNCRRRYPSAP